MFYTVYLLQSKIDGSFYIGYTSDIKRRLKEHNSGLNFSTINKNPWKLIFFEAYINIKDAKRREKYLKTSQGSRLIKRMIKEYLFDKKVEK
ncbi:excinuclease ABC subunit C [Candidatus Berkelbacteria bacterium RIFOXYA2_FULL_43_10]|uniref:Excinuclease ABC subunit C n=1 Tax=Candidatus Berkelbacteria bacterium RIFOXYA2_FULL_43_10 TaxID=1797472 RepID=A0A1F5E4N2_9BACT|nr:MAG: excinuclease ABC subunit C [Candidatus Berkelbacteria bacterium RIFOXYA2_FULL_43_10]